MLPRRLLRQMFTDCYCFLALCFIFSNSNSVRADLIPWTVNYHATASQVFSDQGSVAGITFLSSPSYENHTAPGDTVGTSAIIRTFIASTAETGETFTFHDRPYTLVLTLRDGPSGKTGSLTFEGQFSGTLSMKDDHITATMSSPLIQNLRLGYDYYTVNLLVPPPYIDGPLNFVMPGSPSSTLWKGAFGASISLQTIPQSPEPSSLVLAGLGMLGLAGRFLWRHRTGV
jgi:hypothetical protein